MDAFTNGSNLAHARTAPDGGLVVTLEAGRHRWGVLRAGDVVPAPGSAGLRWVERLR